MYKKANSPPPYWQSILTKIKNLGLRPEIMAMLNNFNQIVWDATPPSSNPNAVAYVSSEDKNADGKIDKIHFVLSKFPPNANEEDIDGIVEMVAKTLVHEYGHIEDFDAEKNQFPGGEGPADQAEKEFEGMLKQRMEQLSSANNTDDSQGMPVAAKFNVIRSLTKLANHLDSIGESKISDQIDSALSKIAQQSSRFYGSPDLTGVDPIVLEKKEEMIIEMAKDAVEKIRDGYYGSIVQKYALTPSIGVQTPLNRYMTPAGEINSVSDAERFLEDLKVSVPVFEELYDQASILHTYHPRRIRGLVLSLDRNLREHKDIIPQVARPAAPQTDTDTAVVDETETPAVTRESEVAEERKNPTILKIERVIGAPETGSWQKLLSGGHLRRFLEDNSGNIVEGLETVKVGPRGEPLERYRDSENYVRTILTTGIKGFGVRGGSEALDNRYSSWLKFVEELEALNAPIVVGASDGHEDYMSKFHAKSLENSAEEIVEDLESGKDLDPWQRTYLAQADLMADSVQERLEQENRVNAMANALDKLFKY